MCRYDRKPKKKLIGALFSVHTTAQQTSGKDTDDCKPVVWAGKDVPQNTTYRVDGKRSYGKPGNESHRVHRRHCTTSNGNNLWYPVIVMII